VARVNRDQRCQGEARRRAVRRGSERRTPIAREKRNRYAANPAIPATKPIPPPKDPSAYAPAKRQRAAATSRAGMAPAGRMGPEVTNRFTLRKIEHGSEGSPEKGLKSS
jgi:hypothetical protein